jgi:glycosidase
MRAAIRNSRLNAQRRSVIAGRQAIGMSVPFSPRKNPRLYEIPALVWLNDLARRFSRPLVLGSVPESVWDELAAPHRGPERSRGADGWDFIWLMGVWERSPASAAQMLADDAARKTFDEALPGWTPEQVLGSPYAVRRYEPDARVGTWEDLDRARAALNKRGIGLMLDFVGNHTALDHPWTREHPEYFIQGSEEDLRRDPSGYFAVETATGQRAILAHGRDPYFPPWPDVAQLDYFSEDMRAAQIAQLAKIAAHCDGLRCDMAMLSLNDVFARTWAAHLADRQPPSEEFWARAIPALPRIVWLAEVYWGLEPRLLQMGFQFAYDKSLYDLLRAASAANETNGPSPAAEIAHHLRAPEETQGRMAHFLENHDEARAAAVFGAPNLRGADSGEPCPGESDGGEAGSGKKHLAAAAALIATLPGMRFFHYGQLDGRTIHLPIALAAQSPDTSPAATAIETAIKASDKDTAIAAIRAFYRNLLAITASPAFHEGAFQLLEVTSDTDASFENLTAYQFSLGDDCRVVIANPGGSPAQGRVHFPVGSPTSIAPTIEAGRQYLFSDELNGPHYLRDGVEIVSQGLYVRLDPFQAHIFRVTPAGKM